MTQEEFNALMDTYLAEHLSAGYYTSQYSGEEIDAAVGKVSDLEERIKTLEKGASA